MTTKPFLTRKDISALTDLSITQIRRNEKKLGIDKAKAPAFNSRFVRYRTAPAMQILRARGVLVEA